MDDRHAQFLIIVGDACLAASLADLPVELLLADGTQLRGVPSRLAPNGGEDEVDDTGYEAGFLIGDAPVRLDAVVGCAVRVQPAP